MAVYFYGCVTLDGYLAAKDHSLDWLYETGSEEETGYGEFYSRMDVTLMGRRTFRELERAGDPGAVYPVFTHGALSCPGFTAVSGDPAEFVKGMGPDRNIWVVGGNTILAPLLDRDLVDCLIVQTAPVLLGAGVPLFAQGEALRRFRLEEVKKYGQFAELVCVRERT